jgi:hypothetical protein
LKIKIEIISPRFKVAVVEMMIEIDIVFLELLEKSKFDRYIKGKLTEN